MKHKPLYGPRFFFATSPLTCPYLPGRMERRVVTELVGRDAAAMHDALSLAGYRRSHSIAYAPACPDCTACIAVRVRVDRFAPSRSQRRVWKRNSDLRAAEVPVSATEKQYAMFVAYQDSRHGDGDMAKMDFRDYRSLVDDTPVETMFVEFHHPGHGLVGACLMDRIENGLSAVYSFFEPGRNKRSLGIYMILWMIARARKLGLAHVYLGYLIAECPKMSYKAAFQPLDAYTPAGWEPLHTQNGRKPR